MENIEDIWTKGNTEASDEDTFDSAFIIQSISETSIGISQQLKRIIMPGMILSLIAIPPLVYNLFFYLKNMPMICAIAVLIAICISIFLYLHQQKRKVNGMDLLDLDLKSLLIYKIGYLEKGFHLVKHCVATVIVIMTFVINVTIENSDGIFELRKIAILTAFYLFVYIIMILLFRLTESVYVKQLRSALLDLEEETYNRFDSKLSRYKKIRGIIAIVMALIFVTGVIFLSILL